MLSEAGVQLEQSQRLNQEKTALDQAQNQPVIELSQQDPRHPLNLPRTPEQSKIVQSVLAAEQKQQETQLPITDIGDLDMGKLQAAQKYGFDAYEYMSASEIQRFVAAFNFNHEGATYTFTGPSVIGHDAQGNEVYLTTEQARKIWGKYNQYRDALREWKHQEENNGRETKWDQQNQEFADFMSFIYNLHPEYLQQHIQAKQEAPDHSFDLEDIERALKEAPSDQERQQILDRMTEYVKKVWEHSQHLQELTKNAHSLSEFYSILADYHNQQHREWLIQTDKETKAAIPDHPLFRHLSRTPLTSAELDQQMAEYDQNENTFRWQANLLKKVETAQSTGATLDILVPNAENAHYWENREKELTTQVGHLDALKILAVETGAEIDIPAETPANTADRPANYQENIQQFLNRLGQ